MKTIFLLFEHGADPIYEKWVPTEPGELLNPYLTLPGAQAAGIEQASLLRTTLVDPVIGEWARDELAERWILRVNGRATGRPLHFYTIEERSVVNA